MEVQYYVDSTASYLHYLIHRDTGVGNNYSIHTSTNFRLRTYHTVFFKLYISTFAVVVRLRSKQGR